MDFYRRILDHQSDLNEVETHLLNEILAYKGALKDVSLAQLSHALFIAPNTLVRMCKKLGFQGFTDFKAVYLYWLEHEHHHISSMSLDERLERTRKLLNQDLVDSVVGMIASAQRVLIFATGLSRLVGDELSERLKTVGVNSETFLYPHLMRHYAKRLREGDVCLAISLSGETRSILEAATIAKAKGAKIVSITGVSKNTLSKMSDVQLYGYSNDNVIENIDIADRLAFSYIVNMLFETYLRQSNEQV